MSAVIEGAPSRPFEQFRFGVALTAERRRAMRVSAALFVFTVLAYWLLGPLSTAFDFQLSQANNLIHGHLDMTEEYTHNRGILERVLYDGKGFCLPLDDPRGEAAAALIENPRFSADCKHYMQHSLGPAFLLAPLAFFFGLTVNQTLVSAFIGGLTALFAYGIVRHYTHDLRTQLALVALAMFGTTLFYSGADGSVWHFAHTTAVFFLFGAIYATVVMRNPLLAGAMIGAAFMCRPTTILGGFFPLVAFSDRWFVSAAGEAVWRRLRLRPLIELAAGVLPFIMLTMTLNVLRFGSPFESGYSYSEQFYQVNHSSVYANGIFDISYVPRHVAVFFEQMPILSTTASYVYPSWAGAALWFTSPGLLIGLFVHVRRYRQVAGFSAAALGVTAAVILLSSIVTRLGMSGFEISQLPLGLHLLPFWLAIGAAVSLAVGLRDRLVLACWAAIVPIALVNWQFAATGWAQFGYRYALDFMPFLFLLAVLAVRRVRWYHVALIGAGILVNLWGMLWIFKFAPAQLFGWTWVGW